MYSLAGVNEKEDEDAKAYTPMHTRKRRTAGEVSRRTKRRDERYEEKMKMKRKRKKAKKRRRRRLLTSFGYELGTSAASMDSF